VAFTTSRTASKIRLGRGGTGQQRRVERHVVKAQPACGLPPQVAPQFLDRLEVRQPVQGLQRDRGGQDLRRHARPSVRRRVHVREHLSREQLATMLGQEREHTPRRDQFPAGLPHVWPDHLADPLTHRHKTSLALPLTRQGQNPRSSSAF
jgi:hypothetical protein